MLSVLGTVAVQTYNLVYVVMVMNSTQTELCVF